MVVAVVAVVAVAVVSVASGMGYSFAQVAESYGGSVCAGAAVRASRGAPVERFPPGRGRQALPFWSARNASSIGDGGLGRGTVGGRGRRVPGPGGQGASGRGGVPRGGAGCLGAGPVRRARRRRRPRFAAGGDGRSRRGRKPADGAAVLSRLPWVGGGGAGGWTKPPIRWLGTSQLSRPAGTGPGGGDEGRPGEAAERPSLAAGGGRAARRGRRTAGWGGSWGPTPEASTLRGGRGSWRRTVDENRPDGAAVRSRLRGGREAVPRGGDERPDPVARGRPSLPAGRDRAGKVDGNRPDPVARGRPDAWRPAGTGPGGVDERRPGEAAGRPRFAAGGGRAARRGQKTA